MNDSEHISVELRVPPGYALRHTIERDDHYVVVFAPMPGTKIIRPSSDTEQKQVPVSSECCGCGHRFTEHRVFGTVAHCKRCRCQLTAP